MNTPKKAGKVDMLWAALVYLGRGWSIIPVNRDKHPRLDSWEEYQSRRPTEKEVRAWWTRWPDANIAVICGHLSGMVVVDVDTKEGIKAVGPYVGGKTLVCTTGGGGLHYYYKHPGETAPNVMRFLPGVDFKGDFGYVVVPPSKHKSGKYYRWTDAQAQIDKIPDGLLPLVTGRGQKTPLTPDDWKTDLQDGERDVEITRRAGRLLQAGVPAIECLETMLTVNQKYCKPPLSVAQVKKIVKSIAGREAAKTEHPPKTRVSVFTVLDQREMLRTYGEGENRWTVADWLPEASCGLLVAPPGTYKTWLLLALAHSVATGHPYLDKWEVAGTGPVLFLQQEDPWGMLQGRLASMFKQQPPTEKSGEYSLDCTFVKELDEAPIFWYTDRMFNFSDRAVMKQLEQRIREIRPRLVMIDPLYTAASTKDYMAEGAQRMAALKLIRDSYGCSFIVSHHTTVSGSRSEDRASIWGSQFLNAWLEFGWRAPEATMDGVKMIRHFKTCEDPEKLMLQFKITPWSFKVQTKKATETVDIQIEEAIFGGTQLGSARDVAKLAKCSVSTAHATMQRMGLKKDKKGYYKLKEE